MGIVIAKAREYINAVEEMDDAQRLEAAAFRDINALKKLTAEFTVTTEQFKKNLAEIGQQTPVEKFQKWVEQMQALVNLQNQLSERTAEHAKLQAKTDLLAGKITPQQYEERIHWHPIRGKILP